MIHDFARGIDQEEGGKDVHVPKRRTDLGRQMQVRIVHPDLGAVLRAIRVIVLQLQDLVRVQADDREASSGEPLLERHELWTESSRTAGSW